MRIRVIGSGSSGNALLVRAGGRTILIDAGVALSRIEAGCRAEGVTPESIDALFVSHEHTDHAGAAALLSKRHRVPVWCSAETAEGIARSGRPLPRPEPLAPGAEADLGRLRVRSFSIPHDAPNVGFRIEADGFAAGVATDLGHAPAGIEEGLADCDALLLESNYDEALLQRSRYPAWLRARIAGREGHLSNAQTGALAVRCVTARTRHLLLLHVSENTNSPVHARDAARRALDAAGRSSVLVQVAARHGAPEALAL